MGPKSVNDTESDGQEQQRFILFFDGQKDQNQPDDPHHDHAGCQVHKTGCVQQRI